MKGHAWQSQFSMSPAAPNDWCSHWMWFRILWWWSAVKNPAQKCFPVFTFIVFKGFHVKLAHGFCHWRSLYCLVSPSVLWICTAHNLSQRLINLGRVFLEAILALCRFSRQSYLKPGVPENAVHTDPIIRVHLENLAEQISRICSEGNVIWDCVVSPGTNWMCWSPEGGLHAMISETWPDQHLPNAMWRCYASYLFQKRLVSICVQGLVEMSKLHYGHLFCIVSNNGFTGTEVRRLCWWGLTSTFFWCSFWSWKS